MLHVHRLDAGSLTGKAGTLRLVSGVLLSLATRSKVNQALIGSSELFSTILKSTLPACTALDTLLEMLELLYALCRFACTCKADVWVNSNHTRRNPFL